jgi:hypothetical protein
MEAFARDWKIDVVAADSLHKCQHQRGYKPCSRHIGFERKMTVKHRAQVHVASALRLQRNEAESLVDILSPLSGILNIDIEAALGSKFLPPNRLEQCSKLGSDALDSSVEFQSVAQSSSVKNKAPRRRLP